MRLETYNKLAQGLIEGAALTEQRKRPGYTCGSEDVLANFKRIAERTGLTPEQVLAVYFLKHVDSITSILCRPDLPVSEAVVGRFEDGINYLKLGLALLVDQRGEQSFEKAA